jgi:CubicO group peptidase (beta-lactamase class C family)
VDQPVTALLPEFAAAAEADPPKGRIHVEHLLTMSSGLDWDEMSFPNGDPRNTLTQMNASADWVGYVVARRAAEVPGSRFVYNSGGTILLGAILRAATGQDVVAFAGDVLFAPLGIANQTWTRNPSHPDQVHTGGGLALRARDAAKIGQVYLDEGSWDGRQVLPAAWVRNSLQPHLPATDGAQYGFNWWLRAATGGVSIGDAWGARGQHVFVVPARRMVVVVTAHDERIDAGRQILDVVIDAASR